MRLALALLAALAAASTAGAAPSRDRLSDAVDGATCEYYNRGAGGAWRHRGGDWIDAAGKAQGDAAYATASVTADRAGPIELDVTRLVADWAAGRRDDAAGLVLRSVGARQGISDIASRERGDATVAPTLVLQGGAARTVVAAADTYLDCTTERGLGTEPRVKTGQGTQAVLRFDLPPAADLRGVTKATLRLTVVKQYGDTTLGVFAAAPPGSPDAQPVAGLAAAYGNDVGIAKDPAVWFASGFEGLLWKSEWSEYDPRSEVAVVDKDPEQGFVPLAGKALRVTLLKNRNLGLDLRYLFRAKGGSEPDEAYFRYYLRFARDWSPDADGGKLPGFAGTYERAGWGQRRINGDDGWSMRGAFFMQPSAANPYRGSTAIGTYAYHLDGDGPLGVEWPWPLGRLGALERERWYCVEQYVKLNTPGRNDGVLRAWIDGRLAFERTDIRVRNVPGLHIESAWLNVYHGGTTPSPRDMHLYLDNVVIARKYIGPLRPVP